MSQQDLQKHVHAAARVFTNTKKVKHITPEPRSLNWLPVCLNIRFKMLPLLYKVLNALGPKYISDLLLHYDPSRPLGSSGTALLTAPGVKTKHGQEAAFFVTKIQLKPYCFLLLFKYLICCVFLFFYSGAYSILFISQQPAAS